MPVRAGIHVTRSNMGPRFRGHDISGVQFLFPVSCVLFPSHPPHPLIIYPVFLTVSMIGFLAEWPSFLRR